MTDQLTTARVPIELCGRLADPCGPILTIELPDAGLDVAALLARIADQHPALAELLERTIVKACVNDTIVPMTHDVRIGDRIALFPPLSGG